MAPVERAALGRGAAVGVHPVHPVLGHQPDQALGQLLDRLVEGLAGAVTVLAQRVVLRLHQTGQGAHQDAALAGQVAVDLVLEGGGEEIAGADGDPDGQRPFLGASGVVLMNGVAGVDATPGQEVPPHAGPRALGRDQDHVEVVGWHHAGLIVVDDGEAVGEVERVSLAEVRLDGGPERHLPRVGDQVLDDGGPLHGLHPGEERLARLPAILLGLVPRALALRRAADDDVDTVFLHVERLGRALHAVTEHGDDLIAKHLSRPLQREFLPGDDLLDDSAKIYFCHFSSKRVKLEK